MLVVVIGRLLGLMRCGGRGGTGGFSEDDTLCFLNTPLSSSHTEGEGEGDIDPFILP